MDQETKNAAINYPLLESFATLCNETKRASFHITKNVKTKKWRVHLSGIHKSFIGDDLPKLLMEAGQFVFDNRQKEDGINHLIIKKK